MVPLVHVALAAALATFANRASASACAGRNGSAIPRGDVAAGLPDCFVGGERDPRGTADAAEAGRRRRLGPSCASYWRAAAPRRRLGRVEVPAPPAADGTVSLVRVVASNHKTGTYLSRCLRAVLADAAGVALVLGGDHVSGGFAADARYRFLHLARDPSVLVDSGYAYHASGPEKWTRAPLDGGSPTYQGEGAAAALLRKNAASAAVADACGGGVPPPEAGETYAALLRRLPPRGGLLVEGLRALDRDIPYEVRAAAECARLANCAAPRRKQAAARRFFFFFTEVDSGGVSENPRERLELPRARTFA